MAVIRKNKKPVNKDCIKLTDAILRENTQQAAKILKNIVKTNIIRKRHKAERECDLF